MTSAPTPSPSAALSHSRRSRFWRAAVSGAMLRCVNIAVQLVSLGVTVRYLGAERYGMWAVVGTFIAWFSLSGAGLGNGLTAKVSEAFGKSDTEAANRYFNSAFAIVSATCFGAGLLLAIISLWIPWARVFNVTSPAAVAEARPLVLVSLAFVAITFPMQLCNSVLTGYQRMDIANMWGIVATVAGMISLLVAVRLQASITVLALILLAPLPAAGFLSLLWCLRRGILRLSWANVSRREMGSLLSLGGQFLLIQFAGIFVFEIGAIIIARSFGAAEVTPYAVTSRLAMLLVSLASIVLAPLWPAYGEAFARGEYAWIRRIFFKTLQAIGAIWIVGALLMVLLGQKVILIWAGPSAVPDLRMLVALLVYTLAHLMGMIVAFPLNGMGKLSSQIVGCVIMAALHLPLSLLLCRLMGPAGVAVSQTACMFGIAIPLTMAHLFRLLSTEHPVERHQIQA